jgi:putative sigma-54 modulation protein
MTNGNLPSVIVSGIHFDLTPSLKTFIQQKTGRLFRHGAHIIRIRVELGYEKRHDLNWFVAKGHISSQGWDLNASVGTEECHKSILLLVDRLDRMLHRQAIFRKESRNHPHGVELAAALPKAC